MPLKISEEKAKAMTDPVRPREDELPGQELQAIRALCLDAGMHPDSTTLDYIRGAFYMLKAYVQKPAVPALPAPQEQDQ